MPLLLWPANLFIVVTYLILSSTPFLPLLFGRTVANSSHIWGMELVAWIAIWSIVGRPAWFHWLLLPAFFVLPLELYLNMYYNQGISTHHLGIIAETSPKEAAEFIGNKVWLLGMIFVGVSGWWIASWTAARRTHDLDWRGPSRWVAICLLASMTGVWLYQQEYGVKQATVSAASDSAAQDEDDDDEDELPPESITSTGASADNASWQPPKLPMWAQIPFSAKEFGQTRPFGLAVLGNDFWKERQYLAELAHKSMLFKFGAQQPGVLDVPQVVVMVIGESSRYDRWSLNGYARDTNPRLKKESNLVSLSNVITAVSATRLSVPVLVSRKPAMQSLQAGFSEKSFLTAFKEAGFKTYWLSNQMSFGQFDTPISVFAKEADVTQFLNIGGFTNNSSYDEILLASLRSAIDDAASKKLIVLHTLGSHWNYSHRYPKEYDKWQPSLFGVENPAYTDLAIKAQLNNSYDNSILYTDWFLSQVIDALKSSKRMATMMYVADHGQTLYDGTCKLAFHGHNTQFEFHVPALVWYSDLYRLTHPVKVTQLQKNKRAKLATENIFHSLLDMADIRYGSEQLEWSFFNKKFKTHKRYVDSYGWSDYDNATFKGDCREVIDKGTPLVQLK
ncbi:sulfatase domain-containing protein [Noviherbaspirillum autotrophicum]|uniref:Sulfatase domain-containing protein n=2 Tax=Noviherbaspirillum autotrophicum TaxID=709839 RepID=A0A0C2BG94_9BURK|nr:phosphoethanolamine transferase [Noviherbaspirillum autotrophicum]KIF80260.1 sulfatase domain-containing protein [Noviherbaspirillum autotrophicum]